MSRNAGETARLEDAVLTRAAQAGDVTALGLLLERHRAGMRAVALSILGPGPDVDDVVQDAAVTALRRVGDVRDPAAVGAWLRMIVRNASRSLLRDSVPFQPLDDLQVPATDDGPERWLEHHAMRDWIWEAMEELSPRSAPVTGPEHVAEAMRLVQSFAADHADHPGLPEVLAAFQAIPTISDDATMTAVARGLLPAYFADYWGREAEFAPLRTSVRAAHISGLDEDLSPHVVDDRADLGSLTVPALVVVGRHDVICGVRWSEELHRLIPGSELLILEDSGHFGHIEEPEAFSQAVARFVTATARGGTEGL